MIRGFIHQGGRLGPLAPGADLRQAVWLDLVEPSAEEVAGVETALGIDVPSREDMAEIEPSSRLYVEDGAAVMTALVPAQIDRAVPELRPVGFVLAGGRLVSVREHAPRSIESFPAWAEKITLDCSSGAAVLMGLLEAIVGREADILERSVREIEALSGTVFRPKAGGRASRDFGAILEALGREGDLISNVRESLVTLDRLFGFFAQLPAARDQEKEARGRLKALRGDARALAGHADALAGKVTFLLDATLGLVTIEQNGIIKIFSVMAVVFLPPTLVASIYGMNFAHMPELAWRWGYPLALGLMAVSAVVPLWFFKRRGWL